jgi:predicted SnoaL-like aldol condensation-catalyzing enzyme
MLTGTPVLSRPIEMFNMLQIIDTKVWNNYYHYAVRYCDGKNGYWGFEAKGATNLDELHEKISKYFLRRTKDEVLSELPPKNHIDIPMDLNKEDREAYDLVESNLIKYLREEVKCDWNEAQFQDYRPITKAYRKQQSLNAKNYIKFISHILTEDGIAYGGDTPQDMFKWVNYNGRKSVCVKEKDIYKYYTNMCERYKYTAYPYDKFIEKITSANTGITKIDKHKMKYLKIDKEQAKVWVDIFRNTQDEVVEVYDDKLEESEDEDEVEPAFVGKRMKV